MGMGIPWLDPLEEACFEAGESSSEQVAAHVAINENFRVYLDP